MPDNSLIFEFCREGNLNGVRQLISRGQGSVRDINSFRETPLHASVSLLDKESSNLVADCSQIAASRCHAELCTFLLESGASREVESSFGL